MRESEYPLRSDSAVVHVNKFHTNALDKSLKALRQEKRKPSYNWAD